MESCTLCTFSKERWLDICKHSDYMTQATWAQVAILVQTITSEFLKWTDRSFGFQAVKHKKNLQKNSSQFPSLKSMPGMLHNGLEVPSVRLSCSKLPRFLTDRWFRNGLVQAKPSTNRSEYYYRSSQPFTMIIQSSKNPSNKPREEKVFIQKHLGKEYFGIY